jgi:glycosyltransferase involved in cell wall biosynthesis
VHIKSGRSMSDTSGGTTSKSLPSIAAPHHLPPQLSHLSLEHRPAGTARTRVVYLDHIARLSGGEIALVRLLTAVRADVEAHVILGEDGPLVEKLQDAGAIVEIMPMSDGLRDARKGTMTARSLPWKSSLDFVRYVLVLRRRLKQLNPDLVHTNSLKSALYGGLAGRLARVPVVWHIRDRIADDYLPVPAVKVIRLLSHFLPTKIIVNSVTTLSTLPLSARSDVLYNAVVPDVIPAMAVRRQLPAEAPLMVGMVGRIAAWKGQDVFLRAFAEAFPDGLERARLIGVAMFGEEMYERELHELVENLGLQDRVQWRGFRSDMPAELAELSVLVHCSITAEPFGQVVVEGMAAGLPVIAAAAGGPMEVIDDGRDGLLTQPGDVTALAQALRGLRDDPAQRARLGVAASQSATRFSPEAAAKNLAGIYQRVLS